MTGRTIPADLARIYDLYSRTEVSPLAGCGPGPADDRPGPGRRAAGAAGGPGTPTDGGRYGTWAVEVRDTGQVVGTIAAQAAAGAGRAVPTEDIEVGWHLHPDSWGHGYATEAARALVDREFAAGTREIYAVVAPGNEPSMAVARRLGMTHVGQRTDWYGGELLETFVRTAPGG